MIEYIAFWPIKEMDWLHGVQFFCAKEHLWQQLLGAWGRWWLCHICNILTPPPWPPVSPRLTRQTNVPYQGQLQCTVGGWAEVYSIHAIESPGLECNLHNLRNLRSKCAPILYLLSCLQPRPHTAKWPSNETTTFHPIERGILFIEHSSILL